jgi:hypothetical protein
MDDITIKSPFPGDFLFKFILIILKHEESYLLLLPLLVTLFLSAQQNKMTACTSYCLSQKKIQAK